MFLNFLSVKDWIIYMFLYYLNTSQIHCIYAYIYIVHILYIVYSAHTCTFYIFNHWWMFGCLSFFWLLWMMLQWTWVYKYPFGDTMFNILGYIYRSEFARLFDNCINFLGVENSYLYFPDYLTLLRYIMKKSKNIFCYVLR